MAPLLSRLFNNRKQANRSAVTPKLCQESRDWRTPVFSSHHQIRVLLFRECDWRGRKLLFDSKTVKRKDGTTKNQNNVTSGAKISPKTEELSGNSYSYQLPTSSQNYPRKDDVKNSKTLKNAISYEYLKPSPDVKMLGEMIFGSVAMSFWGSTMKIHTIRSPPQLMISFVFPTPMPSNQRLRDFDNSGSLQNSISEHLIPNPQEKFDYSSSMAHSVPVDVPGRFNVSSKDLSYNSDSLNSTPSNCSGNTSVIYSPDSQNSSLTRSNSYNSFQRRWLRNLNTNIECGLRRRSDELLSLDEPKITGQRRVKLGLSVIITLGDNLRDENSFRDFFFSHIPLIEGHVTKLVETVSKAYLNKENFVHIVFEGVNSLGLAIQDLYMTPRLSNPMWLSLVSTSSNHHQQCRKFMGEFLTLIRLYDTKQTHFFVSTLLTAILTNHLAWVSTVTPTENNPINNLHKKEAAFWLDQLAISHPYNPLWMQLGDLYGAVGFPCKVSRTVVLGKKAETILRFLQVLSYFIRCSDVYEKINEGGVSTEALKLDPINSPNESVASTPTKLDDKDISKWRSQDNSFYRDSKHLEPATKASETINNLSSVMFLLGESPLSSELQTSVDRNNDRFEQSLSDDENKRNYKEGGADSLGYGSFGNTLDVDLHETNHTSQDDCRWCTNHDRINLNEFVLETVPEVKFESLEDNTSFSNMPTSKKLPIPQMLEIATEILDAPTILSSDQLNQTRLYIQEYRTLRFSNNNSSRGATPVPSSPTEKVHENSTSKVDKEENDGPEEGYQSMDDAQSISIKGLGNMIENLFFKIPPATKEYHLPQLHTKDISEAPSVSNGFGWSLFASLTDRFLPDFCLQGLLGTISEENIYNELSGSVNASVLGEPVASAVCILADTDTWSVKVCSSSGSVFGNKKFSTCMSPLVAGICDSLLQMSQLNMSMEFCLMHLEDRLQELFFRSQSLAAILIEESNLLPQTALEKAASSLAIDTNDIPLLISIATTHSPQLASFNR